MNEIFLQIFTLKDRTSTVFLRGDIDSFLVACDKDLGILERIRIWTDHTGIDPAWYILTDRQLYP